jgi:hypothetical protein
MRRLLLILLFSVPLAAQSPVADWLHRVSETQADQPHWVTPVVTVTPRLEQELRYDFVSQQRSNGDDLFNYGNTKGLELIPTHNTEIIFNVPAYITHSKPGLANGWGDVSFLLKYRLASRNERNGNYIVTAFLAGSIPTGTNHNGSTAAIVTPTIAGGKGFGRFSVQSTLGVSLPVNDVTTIGRSVLFNNAFQYHAARFLWPEVELNSTFWSAGTQDGKKQTFVTPGVVIGRFPLHNRIGLTLGAGFQIAVTQYHNYNHAAVGTIRMPF